MKNWVFKWKSNHFKAYHKYENKIKCLGSKGFIRIQWQGGKIEVKAQREKVLNSQLILARGNAREWKVRNEKLVKHWLFCLFTIIITFCLFNFLLL